MPDISKAFTKQQGQSDCGVACLLSVIKYYGGHYSLETLRKLSGTNITGTTLLGLYQAAKQTGFDALGCEANMDTLASYNAPCILYTHSSHYVVCFGTTTKNKELLYIIGDPAKGISYLKQQQLDVWWETKKCLALTPNESFKKVTYIKQEKRKWVLKLIEDDAPLLAIAATLGIAIATLGLAMAVFSQKLIDEILPKKEFLKLNLGIGLVFSLLLVKEGLSILRQYFLLRQGKDFNIRIAHFFYNHLLQLPKTFFDTRKIGELTARLNDTTRIQRVISQLAGNVVIDALMAVVATIFVFAYSWQVGIGCIAVSPFFYMIIYWHNKIIINGQRAIMGSYAIVEANYISTLQGIEPIKNYNKQNIFASANKKLYEGYQGCIFSLGKVQIKLSFLANSFGALFLTSVLLYTSYQVLHHQLKTGELMAILGMCGTLLPSIANLALISIPISEARIAFERMFEFTSATPEQTEENSGVINFKCLQVQHLSFRFTGRPLLIKDVSFEVNKGEIVALMGENGCGKSTLTQILQKHYIYETGTIAINEKISLDSFNLNNWRKLVGTVPQHTHIFNGTILENIAFNDAQEKPGDVLDFLQEYGFSPFIDNLPQSYMTMVGEEGINLSGGQKQLIALARALYFRPQLLLLDEATAAMDRQTEQFVLQLLQKLKSGMGIIFITHRLHVLRYLCDRIYILEQGVVNKYGSHELLLETENLYSKYWADLALEK